MANIYPFDGATSHYLMPNPYGFPMAWLVQSQKNNYAAACPWISSARFSLVKSPTLTSLIHR